MRERYVSPEKYQFTVAGELSNQEHKPYYRICRQEKAIMRSTNRLLRLFLLRSLLLTLYPEYND